MDRRPMGSLAPLATAALLLVAAGHAGAAPEAVPSQGSAMRSPSGAAEESALARATAGAGRLGSTLRARIVEAMGRGGPSGAVTVCGTEAQALTAKVREESGAAVGRSSLRLRNPANAAPPWVGAWLATQGERPAEGVSGLAGIAETPSGPVARVLRPIAVEAPCLVCHGPAESTPPEVRALLGEKYPTDRATGYRLGDLRGALWAEVPITP